MHDIVKDEDLSALAAEYVIGTLDPDERTRANVLLEVDEGFRTLVRAWERRLGELHLMVEPVEPDARIWERVRGRLGIRTPEAAPPPFAPAPPPFVPPPFVPSPPPPPFGAQAVEPARAPAAEQGFEPKFEPKFERTFEEELERLGAEVLVLGADVADEAEMRAAVERAIARFGEINGVIHAAGVPSGGVIPVSSNVSGLTACLASTGISARISGSSRSSLAPKSKRTTRSERTAALVTLE